MIALMSGLIAGAAHVWAGPDHLAAIAPLAANKPARAWLPGARWGLGHSTGVIMIGLLLLLFREALPIEMLSGWSERIVGVMLVAIGVWAVLKATRTTIHAHEHEHDGERHLHIHAHGPKHEHSHQAAHKHTHAAVGIGLLHGLAGSSHFFGVLPMLALPNRWMAIGYLLTFSLGTILAMAVFSAIVGLTAERFRHRTNGLYRGFMVTCGAAAVVVGGFWLLGPGH